jgi:hypothetical protein
MDSYSPLGARAESRLKGSVIETRPQWKFTIRGYIALAFENYVAM